MRDSARDVWRVTGEVDVGAVSFPIFRVIAVKYTARDWETALDYAAPTLIKRSNGLSPVTVFKVERIQPPVPKVG